VPGSRFSSNVNGQPLLFSWDPQSNSSKACTVPHPIPSPHNSPPALLCAFEGPTLKVSQTNFLSVMMTPRSFALKLKPDDLQFFLSGIHKLADVFFDRHDRDQPSVVRVFKIFIQVFDLYQKDLEREVWPVSTHTTSISPPSHSHGLSPAHCLDPDILGLVQHCPGQDSGGVLVEAETFLSLVSLGQNGFILRAQCSSGQGVAQISWLHRRPTADGEASHDKIGGPCIVGPRPRRLEAGACGQDGATARRGGA
jgi:hypothetical protein